MWKENKIKAGAKNALQTGEHRQLKKINHYLYFLFFIPSINRAFKMYNHSIISYDIRQNNIFFLNLLMRTSSNFYGHACICFKVIHVQQKSEKEKEKKSKKKEKYGCDLIFGIFSIFIYQTCILSTIFHLVFSLKIIHIFPFSQKMDLLRKIQLLFIYELFPKQE